jgi:hypothetical protein
VKVAVVIPTRNEARTIAALTAVADAGLGALGGGALIVNADGGSDDGTGEMFLATPTVTPKRHLAVEGAPPGKGRNLLAAWRLCLDEDVDAVVNLDGDMTSVQPWWLESFVRPIAARGAAFVSPLYRRNLYRAVTARNIARAFVYGWFGVDVQHPLSGNTAIARPLLERLVARDWTEAQLGYGVETAVVATVLAEGRPWTTAQLDICKDADRRFGQRKFIVRDTLAAAIEIAREFAPCAGPGGPAVMAPMTFIEGPPPETAWLEAYVAGARNGSAPCRHDHARWERERPGEIAAALEAGRLDASAWFHVFARALLEARGLGRARPAAHYAAALAPLLALRALTVWREIAGLPAEAVDAAAAAEIGPMRAAVADAAGWPDDAAELGHRRWQSATS